jgi:hypothetical protein
VRAPIFARTIRCDYIFPAVQIVIVVEQLCAGAHSGMSIFKSFAMTWWQAALLKLSAASVGIIIGATWPDIFIHWRPELVILCVLSGLFVLRVWWKQ